MQIINFNAGNLTGLPVSRGNYQSKWGPTKTTKSTIGTPQSAIKTITFGVMTKPKNYRISDMGQHRIDALRHHHIDIDHCIKSSYHIHRIMLYP